MSISESRLLLRQIDCACPLTRRAYRPKEKAPLRWGFFYGGKWGLYVQTARQWETLQATPREVPRPQMQSIERLTKPLPSKSCYSRALTTAYGFFGWHAETSQVGGLGLRSPEDGPLIRFLKLS